MAHLLEGFVVICFQISIFEPLETTQKPLMTFLPTVVICFQISIFEPLETTILDENEPLTEL